MLVVLAMLVAALSLWTAIPLTWIYIGSQLSDTQFPSGGPYMLVFVGIVISILIIAWLLGRLNGLYVRITGTNTVEPIRPAWLKSMRDTGPRTALGDGAGDGDRRLGDPRGAGDDRLVLRLGRLAAAEPVSLGSELQTTNLPSSCSSSPSTSILPPRRRSQTRSVCTADSLIPPDSG